MLWVILNQSVYSIQVLNPYQENSIVIVILIIDFYFFLSPLEVSENTFYMMIETSGNS
jgi:hypothetical protein